MVRLMGVHHAIESQTQPSFAMHYRYVAIIATLVGGTQVVHAASPTARPNILFIVADDMGYADAGFQGCKDIATPNLDSLAAASVRFTNGYVSGPYCSPTRAGLLTGRYQQRFGHEFNVVGGASGLPLTEKTLADRLKAVGYHTGLVGKWHLGGLPAMLPQKRGFDDFYGFIGGEHSYTDYKGMLRGTMPEETLDYTTDAFARESAVFITKQKGSPWFLYLAFNAVHTPLQATAERLAKVTGIANPERRKYAAMMIALDEAIGQVRQSLADSGQDENTLICFISDNGGPTMPGTTINASSNAPLRGSKRTTLEGGIRVPFLISWKGKLTPKTYDQPAIQLDLNTTALCAAGVNPKPAWKLDGINLIPFLTGEKTGSPHDALFWRLGGQMAIRVNDYKLVRYDQNADTRTGSDQAPTPPRLYHLSEDIAESHDLASEQPEKLKELQSKWNEWSATLAKPLWGASTADSDGPEPSAPHKKSAKAKP